mgnify:CR=1 FL=1
MVSTDRLVEAVWGDDVPASATASLQAYISNLRRALRGSAETQVTSPIVRRPPGYYLDVDPDTVDLTAFSAGCARAGAAVESEDWAGALTEAAAALDLWRGNLLEDMADAPWVRDEAAAWPRCASNAWPARWWRCRRSAR